jgi:ribosomal protein S27E
MTTAVSHTPVPRRNEATGKSTIIATRCPRCQGPVFAPSDSVRERIDCTGCGAPLVTRQGIEGLEVTQIDGDPS